MSGWGLPRVKAGRAEQPVSEKCAKAETIEHLLEPPCLARRGDGEKPIVLAGEEGLDPLDRQHLRRTRSRGPVDQVAERVAIQAETAFLFDLAIAIGPAQTGIAGERFLAADGKALLGQDVGEDGVGKPFAVDDDSVEIENYRLEPHPGAAGRRSPNKAVPTRTWVAPIVTALS
jgi:hypothetical protein